MQGEDLTLPLEGKTPPAWRDAVYAEAVDQRMIRTREYKLVHYAARPYGELYDLTNDPHELTNRYDDPAFRDVREALQRKLLDRMVEMESRQHPPVRYLELDDPLHQGDTGRRVRLPFI